MMELSEITKLAKDGINTKILPVGTKLEIQTKNNLYYMEKIEGNEYTIQGGKYWPEPTTVRFPGSTFGGSVMKINWIGHLMHMEIYDLEKGCITTSSVRNVKIITSTYSYAMDWKDQEDISENTVR